MKTLKMHFAPERMENLKSQLAEAGMGFWVIQVGRIERNQFAIVLSDEFILPCYQHDTYFDLEDYLRGDPWPVNGVVEDMAVHNSLEHRNAVVATLNKANIPTSFTGITGAVPLIGKIKLAKRTKLIRNLKSSTDFRFDPKAHILSAKTYLTTQKDILFANTGFAIVGRYSLPIALPASYFKVYELMEDADVEVGTVEPLFRQSGGGVEIRLVKDTLVRVHDLGQIDDY